MSEKKIIFQTKEFKVEEKLSYWKSVQFFYDRTWNSGLLIAFRLRHSYLNKNKYSSVNLLGTNGIS